MKSKRSTLECSKNEEKEVKISGLDKMAFIALQ